MSHEVLPRAESRPAPAGWRRSKRTRPVPQHNWQVELPPERSSGERWRLFRLFGLLAVLMVLMGAFVLVAMDAPRKTPMLIVTDVRPGPIPQSPWLDEEIERLKLLDQTTLSIRNYTPSASVGAAFTEFHQSLKALVAAADQTGVVVVYVRLPGLVDDTGRPCLIPAHASLVRTEEWLPVEAILDHVASDLFPDHVRRLVIFDRSQPACVWPAGVLADTFSDQLAGLMKRQHEAGHWRSLAVLTDTSHRQNGWHSATTGGSVFGEAVWSALTGHADAIESGGNGDQCVTLSEFATYVTRRTTEWVQANRQQVQTPTLISAKPSDGNLVWAATSSTQHDWQARADRLRTAINRDGAIERMIRLWDQRLALEPQAPWRFDPVGWQQLSHSLLNYERLIAGGNSAARQRDDVERSIQSLLAQLSESTHCRLPLNPGEARLHHRHLTQRVNANPTAESTRLANVFSQLRERPSRQLAKTLLIDLHRHGPVRQDWDLIVLHHLIEDAPDAAWSQTELMSRTLGLLEVLGDLQALSEVTVSGMLNQSCESVEADARAILDRMFVGTDNDLEWARERLSVAEDKVATCRQFSQQLIQAIDQRDRAAAELPRLAEWIYAPHHGETEETARQRIGEWIAATKSWKRLEQALENCREQGGTAELVSAVSTVSTELERELAVLWVRVDRTYDRLLTDPVDAVAVAEMEHMLSTSLLPRQPDSRSRSRVEQRMGLYETWQQAVIQLEMQHAASLSSGKHKPETVNAVVADDWMIQIVRGAAPHPMSLMLSLGDHTVDLSAPSTQALREELLTKAGERTASIRRHLACIPQILLRDRLTSFDAPELRDRAWQTQARQIRVAAPWLSGDLPYNPCERMELAAWGSHLRRRAACIAEDFWFGPLDSDVPFFVQAATDLLDAAVLCEAGFASSLTATGRAATNALRQRLASERTPLHVTAIAVPQILSSDELQTNVSVMRSPETRMPMGTAAVFISQPDRSTETTVPRVAADIPAEAAVNKEPTISWVNLRCSIPTANPDDSPSARAVALFRGHRYADTFELAPTAGLIARSIPADAAPSTVVVQSHQRRPNAILFILDASASMTDNVPREGNRGSVRKLDAAMEALTALLHDLADQPEIQVGVTIYGHRVASGDTAAAGVVRQPLYRQRFPFPASLQPYEDVETVLPLGRFGVIERSQIADRLHFVRPWGETPLYLSLVQGLEQFESLQSDVTKTIVVITDGLNYQFNPTPEKQTRLDDVLRAVTGRDVSVHLVGFGIADQQIDKARSEFSRIAEATGGSSDVTVRDAGRLQAYLRALTLPPGFSVEGRNGFSAAAKVGQPIVLPAPVTNAESFDLRFETASTRIAIVGGEKLAFRPAVDGTLRIVADLPERSVSLQDHDSGAMSPCELIASRPVWKGDRLCVRWSLRERDGQFTPRPTIGYFQLQPLDTSGIEIGNAAVCIGAADLPGQPLPTWEFQIPAWPRTAVTARVQGWITNAPVTEDGAESLSVLLEKQQTDETWHALPNPNIGWQIRHDGASLTLIERYDTITSEPQVWSDLSWDRSQMPQRLLHIERRFDAEHHLFVQTWTFDRDLAPADLANLQFHFTRLDRLRAQGCDTTSALLLPVVSDKLVIQPVPVMKR